jgi:membrane fusion protein
MNQPNKKPGPAPQKGEERPLPLFRPEALASQQQKLYGEILLIRPLSLTFLAWLGVAIAASLLAFLILGQITEKARVSGVLLPAHEITAAPTEADLFVPDGILRFVQPGEHLLLIGPADQRQSVTVQRISGSAVSPAEVPSQGRRAATHIHRVVVMLSSPISGAPSATDASLSKIEAEIPLGRKPLIKWLFGRPGA